MYVMFHACIFAMFMTVLNNNTFYSHVLKTWIENLKGYSALVFFIEESHAIVHDFTDCKINNLM